MIKESRGRASFTPVLVVLALVLVNGSVVAHGQTMSMSIPSLHTTGKERVCGFEIHITAGRIAALPNVPIGWSVSVDNDPSWNTVIKASLEVGAAAVDPSFFRDFLVIEKDESLGVPFDVQGEIVVSEDFATERRIKIGINDFVMKNVAAKSHRNAKKRRSGGE